MIDGKTLFNFPFFSLPFHRHRFEYLIEENYNHGVGELMILNFN